MNKKQLLIILALIGVFPVFASDQILSQGGFSQMLAATALDQFNSAINNNSGVAFDRNGSHTVFAGLAKGSPLEFSGANSYKLDGVTYLNHYEFVPDQYFSETNGDQILVGQTTLVNTSPIQQDMPTSEYEFSYSQKISTTTTCGWDVSALVGFAQGVGTTGIGSSAFSTGPIAWVEWAGALKVGVDALTTDSIETITSYKDKATSFEVPVPSGCKATVFQSLSQTVVSGEHTLYSYLGKDARLQFNVATGSANKHTDYSGYVNIRDLITYGSIPQNFLAIESSGKIAIKGRGSYNASIIRNPSGGAINDYDVHVEYSDAIYGSHSCMPPVAAEFSHKLAQAQSSSRSLAVKLNTPLAVAKVADGFNFKIADSAEHRKIVATRQNTKPAIKSLANSGSSAKCWNNAFGS